MNGQGFIKGMLLTLRHFFEGYAEDIRYGFRKYAPDVDNFEVRQGTEARGVFTVQYPDEKLATPERFRFVPFLVVEDYDDELNPGKDWCTSCGICAKVCPPQCIWIVRSDDPVTGRPVPEPEAFFIDIDICMNCGFCAEFCPFDAIKMDHDYELASYDRTTNHVFDKEKLSKELRYWKHIAPTRAEAEAEARGSVHHKNFKKSWNTTKAEAQQAQDAKASKREEVRARKAETAEKKAAPTAEAPTVVGDGGKAPWEEEEAKREARRQAALARKAARAKKREEQGG
jgi:NADH-quinone oxidoreductase subunit I